jgi:hypothetical protein
MLGKKTDGLLEQQTISLFPEQSTCLFVFTRPAGPAWLTLSFSQPHVSRRFQNRKASMGFYWLPRHAECVFLPYTCQTILFQIPVSLRKSSIWLAIYFSTSLFLGMRVSLIIFEGLKMTPEITKTVMNKIIFNVWIENGPVLLYVPGIELAFRSNSYV